MKKTITGIFITFTMLGALGSGNLAFAGSQTIDGREGDTTGDIQVNGIIGEFDNTTPGPNPDDINRWINVTIPTTVLFYTTEASQHRQIVSPTYTITNNSAVGVIAYASNIENPLNMEEVDLLFINDIELFSEGRPTLTETELFTLSGTTTMNNTGTFAFTGNATALNSDEESNPSFDLVLGFAPDIEEEN
ncbi:hypothetical protein [Enterococcus sp. DIV0876]|uniref:hypothetical protein n=1 Tax=Enterococcus sp. DIV0876 TaxID=2774633 RepID=UPI003D2FA2BD